MKTCMKQPTQRVRNPADYGYPSPDIVALSVKALEVTRHLTEAYGESRWSGKDPMSMLVDILLSHRTRDEQTAAGYDSLLQHFGSWEGVRDAPVNEVQDAIANVNFPEVKAPRIQAIMRRITEERGKLDLNFLCQLPVEEAAAWLNRFEGVGPKTTACVPSLSSFRDDGIWQHALLLHLRVCTSQYAYIVWCCRESKRQYGSSAKYFQL